MLRPLSDLLGQLELSMVIQDGTTPFARHVDDLHDRVRAANELRTERLWSLTAAELRVAQYLPTNLSLSDIATRLYVSRNTVKSHAAAIYRKLGTSSRGEAVRLARSAGLIGDTPPSD
jgi:LuxR family maltose regulon positive regulatory protein